MSSYKYLSSKIAKAKMQHSCGLCGLPIFVGELHHAQRQVFDGWLTTFHSHTKCHDVTTTWGAGDWENQDVMEFRKELERKENAK